MTTSASDSIVTVCHLFSTASVTTWKIALASSSSIDPSVVGLCQPPHISPEWFRAMTPIPHWPVAGHHEASQLILIMLFSNLFHHSDFCPVTCLPTPFLVTFISPKAFWISVTMVDVFGEVFSKTNLHLAFHIVQHIIIHISHYLLCSAPLAFGGGLPPKIQLANAWWFVALAWVWRYQSRLHASIHIPWSCAREFPLRHMSGIGTMLECLSFPCSTWQQVHSSQVSK